MCSQVEEAEQPQPPYRFRIFAIVPTRVKWLILLFSFSAIGYGFFLVVVTAHLPELGIGSGSVGLIIGVSGLTLVLSAVPLGILSDRRGRKWILILGTLGLAPSLIILAYTRDINLLILAGILAGISEGAFLSTWNAMIADMTTLENRDSAFALSFVVSSMTIGIGFGLPVLFPPLMAWTGMTSPEIHRLAIIAVAFLSLLTPILVAVLFRGYRESIQRSDTFIKGKSTRLMLKFSGVNGLVGLGAGFIIPLIPTWLFLKFGVLDSFSGPLWAVANLTIAFTAAGSARLSKRFGHVSAIVMTQSLSMAFMVSIAFVPDVFIASALFVIRTGAMNMSVPIMDSFLMSIISKDERGLASAINSIFWRLPNSITTIVGGYLLQAGYLDLPFLIAAVFYIIAIILFHRMFRDVKPRPDAT